MRRRNLLGGDSIEYVFSAQTYVSVSYNGSSMKINITSTANGTNIGYSVVSYDGTVVTGVTTAATYVTIRYSANSTYYERSGNVVLKQNDSNKTITLNIRQYAKPLQLDYGGILLDGTSGSRGSIDCGNVTFSNVPSWATVTYSSGKINVTASSNNSGSTARTANITVNGGSQSTTLVIIQLPSDYHSRSYVSIGGVNWAIKNVGANSVQDYGNYYQWGAGSTTYKNEDQYYTGTENPLPSSYDTATQVMGEGWRMPTKSELSALGSYDYLVSYNGVNGSVFNSSGNMLFLPAGGYYSGGSKKGIECNYWSSTPYNSTKAYGLTVTYEEGAFMYDPLRRLGLLVRGVHT